MFFLFWGMNKVVDWLPAGFREGVRPYVFVGPALVILSVFLVYPVFNTILISFKDARGQNFVGLDNYKFVFTDPSMLHRHPQHGGLDRPRSARRREHRPRLRDARRSAPSRRGDREVA